ncbi:MAG TPA: proline--tRNA ligase [Acidimicrobiales bacterium]|nr:proline--tRNA ligase [Acidimicrobiales bacterium]
MRMSRLLLRTRRDAPADAEAASHRLLIRAGYIRRTSSGVHAFLPLGRRVLANVERVVREELDAAGVQEILLPALQPRELWEASGRASVYEDILFGLEGRGGRMVLGPTHEELATVTVSADVESWRDLPVSVYQVQTKFRDEARPRFGLLRGREFLMADAYSFDPDEASMAESYRLIHDAVCRVFDRCGIEYRAVEADSGGMGGSVSHEIMVPSPIGEDHFALCPACGWAANTEVASSGGQPPSMSIEPPPAARVRPTSETDSPLPELVLHHTPGAPGIEAVVEYFRDQGLTAEGMLKCIALLDAAGGVVLALVPGDREVLVSRTAPGGRPFEDADFAEHPELVKGYIGPMGMVEQGVRVVADHSVARRPSWVTGANRADHHVSGATAGRDFQVGEWASIATIAAGDPCPACAARVELVRAVEAAHTFQLGRRYSDVLEGASFMDESGAEAPFWMGCYGIGVSRLVAIVAEATHDEAGLCWPPALAPYAVHLVSLGASEDVLGASQALYRDLGAAGVSVLWDDRPASAGVKFADADLVGIPVQVLVGARGLAKGVVEVKNRATGERSELAPGELAGTLPL